MPAVQYDYDGYDYIVKKRNTATRSTGTSAKKTSSTSSRGYAPNSSAKRSSAKATASRTTTVRATSTRATTARATTNRTTSTRTASARPATRTTAKKATTVEAVKSANRASVRAIMAENGKSTTKKKATTTRRKTTNKNLEVPEMLKAKAAKPKEMSLKHADKMVAPKKKAKTVAKKKESVLKTMALSMFAFSMLFLICYRSSAINESFNALGNIKSDLEDANTVNAQLASDIETQTDISAIETYAKYQLGMQKPKDSQIKKIVIDKEDKISTPVVIEAEDNSTFSRFLHDIKNLLD
ncbi:MAG: hypothetical protein IKJ32_05780 [Clostridia bacterium]|nr:hypothetical protein [Clostridia bacterium]